MDILINVVLPLSLAIIMFSLGIGLTVGDFTRVLKAPRAFAAGAIAQVIILPVVAFGIVLAFDLPPALSAGIMLLAFCPGGVTSNVISKWARADVALSVSLTAVISLLSLLTVPALTAWAVTYFMAENAPDISIASLTLAVFAITTVPVCLGVFIRHVATGFAIRIDPVLSLMSSVLFVIIVIAAIASNWALFTENLSTLGPSLVTLNLVLIGIGLAIARGLALDWSQTKTVAVETGIQNGTLGIALGTLIANQPDGFLSPLTLPSAIYGVTMYLVVTPFVLWFRRPRGDS
ncbi:bile acid:sodium symporter family protein [uncultured Tateyamaria sp.]|uniref:bile acid:sodium symporter family protein n=1 Tax=uncultured Tateyamaria sp. TaxID=455651 RepID=UPI00262C655C|nr:bile acid:sodium symporter family protein [uncultured Tateyamaria sp.]